MAPCLESHDCTLVLSLFGIILIFADPTTDILALVEFYREVCCRLDFHYSTMCGVFSNLVLVLSS